MIANIKIGKNFIGALEYNTSKINHSSVDESAILLETNFRTLETDSVKNELNFLHHLNPKLQRTTFHTSLNFAKNESISDHSMLSIAREYMYRMGFDDNLYAIVRHNDTDHPHCHILCHRINFQGRTVSDSNSYHKSNEILRDLEQQFGLARVNSIYDSENINITKNEIEYTLRTKKPTIKQELNQSISSSEASAADIKDFINRLEQKGIKIFFRQDVNGNPTGLLFLFKEKVMSASKINKRFALGQVLDRFDLTDHPKLAEFTDYINERTNKALVSQGLRALNTASKNESPTTYIKAIVSQVLSRNTSLSSFISNLEAKGINFQFNVAKTGRVTGMSMIYGGYSYKSSAIDRAFSSNQVFKQMNYEQIRDSKAIGEANARTRAKYGNRIPSGGATAVRQAGGKSASYLQKAESNEQSIKHTYRHSANASQSLRESIRRDDEDSQAISENTPAPVGMLGALVDHGFARDGLNSQKNDRKSKKYKPSL